MCIYAAGIPAASVPPGLANARDLTWFPVLHPEDQRDGKWIYQPEIHDGTTLRMDRYNNRY